MKRALTILAISGFVILVPAAALAQGNGADEGVLVRIKGNASITEGEHVGVVVVVRGDLVVTGEVGTVVVVSGTATIDGGGVDTLVVVRGDAVLTNGATVTDDVWLTNSDITVSEDSTVVGTVRHDFGGGLVAGLWVLGLLLGFGVAVLAILGALTFAAVAPRLAHSTGDAIRTEFAQVVVAGLVFWIAVPVAAGFLIITLIGIPAALAVWFGVMPVFAFLGYIVSGMWLGGLIAARDGGVGHPYLAAFVGTLLLVVVGVVPGIGWLVGMLASLLGGSALALLAWRSFRAAPESAADADPAAA